ncbi:hypothetical protein NADFUDRAFT_83312 [Nadsonia fulvescens var. elongata DSM 6958]|uniref:RRM domain-containing protein n=1 Tax=Nadsonia fulvescens var. elongata DSM 6958 TaxID=857566 RepID=A0A1E3PIL0_9ASCO|nr:hypothetical protein NADFUDRAFT_83312 [Nadsonia fulvescens var. elongata DSM 6958]
MSTLTDSTLKAKPESFSANESTIQPSMPSASETLYIRNINEKINISKLKADLKKIFSEFGSVIDVVAHKNIRMRGQAFVVFDNIDASRRAFEAKQNMELYGKTTMVQFAKSKSDATVSKQGRETLEFHKKKRLAAKELRQVKEGKNNAQSRVPLGPAGQPATSRAKVEASGVQKVEYLPPHKVLFIQNLPASATKNQLVDLFSTYTGYQDVRFVGVRKVAFIDFENDEDAVKAKEATIGLNLDGNLLDINYAKK